MSDQYFLGREQDGDEDGVYPEDVYDGKIWVVDPDLPDDPERGPNGPEVFAEVWKEKHAQAILDIIIERNQLKAACEAMIAHLDGPSIIPTPELYEQMKAALGKEGA